ncbi:MAG: sn-glycerol-3-phosphate ABC transporter ATP-binding protein UgpC [Pseudomonadota bacterium]
MARVSYADVVKTFGETEVIKRLSLDMADGEFVAYVGPSGCGKTTLLRLLSGLETVTSGRIFIGEREVTDLSPKARNVAMVFQNYALYPHMTVAENIGFGLRVRGVDRAERDRTVRRTAEILEIGALLERKPRELSGGQRQRVAMGRAIVREPDVFLMDEPLSNLDAQLRAQMRSEIRQLHRRLGATMVYVTHDQVEAMTMADRIVVLRGGVIQQVGHPDALFERPANRFVAGFIGTPAMNFLDVADTGGPTVEGAALPDLLAGAAEIGVRPQDLHLLEDEAPAMVAWEARVDLVEPLGGETVLHLTRGGAAVRLRHPGPARAAVGQIRRIGFHPADAHAFDAEGRALDGTRGRVAALA